MNIGQSKAGREASGMRVFIPALAAVAALAQACLASSQVRTYSHGFQNGNLIANWSFEAKGQAWSRSALDPTGTGLTVDPRVEAPAVSGSYVGRFSGFRSAPSGPLFFNFHTPLTPINFLKYYTLSFYVRSTDVTNGVRPVIRYFTDRGAAPIQEDPGEPYARSGGWTLYQMSFYPPYYATYFQLGLACMNNQGEGGTLDFDDVVLEEGGLSPRDRIIETVDYLDALGRPHQSQGTRSSAKADPFATWTYHTKVRVNTAAAGVAGNLANFPVLVRLNSTHAVFGQARADGQDIRFTDMSGNALPYEIEEWNNTAKTAALWVLFPRIEGNKVDNDIFMHWGNSNAPNGADPRNLFNEYQGFHTVWHMNQNPKTEDILNSANSLGNGGAEPNNSSVTGNIGKGVAMGPTRPTGHHFNSYPSSSSTQVSVSAWVRLSSLGIGGSTLMTIFQQYSGGICSGNSTKYFGFRNGKLYYSPNDWTTGNSYWEIGTALTADNSTFYHIAVTYDNASSSNVPSFYVNGVKAPIATTFGTVANVGEGFTGNARAGEHCEPRAFHGTMDEFRVESVVRSRDWIALNYATQRPGANVVSLVPGSPNIPEREVFSATTYDAKGRPDRSYLPCAVSNPDMVDPSGCASDPDMPANGGFNYIQGRYAADPSGQPTEIGLPGANNNMASGHTSKGDFYYLNTLAVPVNIETPVSPSTDSLYLFRWAKSPDGNYVLTWTDKQGRIVQKASNQNRVGANPSLWRWSYNQIEYFRNGSIKRIKTPLDLTGAGSFSEVSAYNSAGKKIAQVSPDRGLVKTWMNRMGQIRFTQDEGQRASNQYTFFEYDRMGRLLSKGSQVLTVITQAIADQDPYTESGQAKTEHVGYIYDNLYNFQVRTGVNLIQAMPDAYWPKPTFLSSPYGHGRMVCAYNRNVENTLGLPNSEKIVAEFFLYEAGGALSRSFKYFGPVRTADARYQEVNFIYDELGRPSSVWLNRSITTGEISSYHYFTYDEKGRLKKVEGTGTVEIGYTGWNAVKYVILGGNGTGTDGTRVDYAYHTLGGIREIKATQLATGKVVYQQFLGYDGKSNGASQVPATTPRYDGTITQQLYKFAEDVNSQRPVRLVNYKYDELGRMLSADQMTNLNTIPLNADGTINFGALTWQNLGTMDSQFDYDLNGRITGQRSGGLPAVDSARYVYQANSYKLDRVSGKITPSNPRNMAAAGTFVYNGRGVLTQDKSKDVGISYNWDLKPVLITKGASANPNDYLAQSQFYDADGNRVAKFDVRVTTAGTTRLSSKTYMIVGGRSTKEWHETYSGSTITSTTESAHLFGSSLAGRLKQGSGPEYFIYNHQGSLIMTVDENGNEPASGRIVNDYMAYGDLRRVKTNSDAAAITPSYTGKEYEDLYDLYAFGSRMLDAELGVWNAPDPANQFHNPYGFGGNPINGVDADGNAIIFVNGVGGSDDEDFRYKICSDNPDYCRGKESASWGRNYSGNFFLDLGLALYSPWAVTFAERWNLAGSFERAYQEGQLNSSGLHVFGHSGGASTSGYYTMNLNMKHGYGSVDSRTTIAGFDLGSMGTMVSTLTGTRTRHYYNAKADIVSYGGAIQDVANPVQWVTDPQATLDVINLDHWNMCDYQKGNGPPGVGNHNSKRMGDCSIWDAGKEIPIAGVVLDLGGTALDNVVRGVASAYWEHVNPVNYGVDFYRIFSSDEPWNNKLDAALVYFPEKAITIVGDTFMWTGHTAADLYNTGERVARKTGNALKDVGDFATKSKPAKAVKSGVRKVTKLLGF